MFNFQSFLFLKFVKKIPVRTILIFGILTFSVFTQAQSVITLEEALKIGLDNNYSIKLQRNEEQIAKNNNTLGNAGFLPSVGLNASQSNTYGTISQKPFNDVKSTQNNANTNVVTAGIQLNWTLFDGFNMFTNQKTLGLIAELGQVQVESIIESTVADIMLLYYGIIQNKQVVSRLQEAAALSAERKRISEAKLKLGSGSELMLLQSTVDLNADSSRLIQQMRILENSKIDFNRLLARDPRTNFDVLDSITLISVYNYEALASRALSENKQLQEARLDTHLAELSVKSIESERYPRLGFNSAYNFSNTNYNYGTNSFYRQNGPQFGFTLNYNLFNGGSVSRRISNAKLQQESSETSFQQLDLDIRTNLLKSFTDYRNSLELVRIENANQNIAAENVKIAFEKYTLGTINDIELREIQNKLIDTQYALLQAQFEAKKAEIGLKLLSGMLLKKG